MFKRVNANINLPLVEAEMSAYWDKINAFETSVENRKNDKTFRFYDGPPFPTGSPHYGNLLAGVIKDIVYAHMWKNISASNGIDEAREELKTIEKKMTSSDISEAQRLARECVKKNYKGC